MTRPKPKPPTVPKRQRAPKRPLRMPEPIDASPEDIARACMFRTARSASGTTSRNAGPTATSRRSASPAFEAASACQCRAGSEHHRPAPDASPS